jgi:TorA-specific chaperone
MPTADKQSLLASVQMMADFFWGPTPEQSDDLLLSNYWQPFESILPDLDSSALRALESIKAFLSTFPGSQILFESLEEEYVRLFINDRQGLRTLLYASCHVELESGEKALLMGEPALEMQRRFQSKGLSLAEDIGEPPDHLSIELEYLYYLLDNGWASNNDQLIREATAFAAEGMLPWVQKMEQSLKCGENPGHFYPHLVFLLMALLRFIGTINTANHGMDI